MGPRNIFTYYIIFLYINIRKHATPTRRCQVALDGISPTPFRMSNHLPWQLQFTHHRDTYMHLKCSINDTHLSCWNFINLHKCKIKPLQREDVLTNKPYRRAVRLLRSISPYDLFVSAHFDLFSPTPPPAAAVAVVKLKRNTCPSIALPSIHYLVTARMPCRCHHQSTVVS